MRPSPATRPPPLFSKPTSRRWLAQAGIALAVLSTSSGAWAQQFLANKKFAPTAIEANSTAQLGFQLFNSSDELLNATVVDTLPATSPVGQLWFSPADMATATVAGVPGCTLGTVTLSDFFDAPANIKARTIKITNAAVPIQAPGVIASSCQIAVPVHSGAVSTDVTVVNSVPDGGASAKNAGGLEFSSEAFSASLTIRAAVNPLPTTKTFNPSNVPAGGESTLTITVQNSARPARTLTNVQLLDTLPIGLLTTAAPAFTAACGTPTSSTNTDSPTVAMSGATIAANGSCVITVKVKAPDINTALVNTIPAGGVTADGGVSNSVAATATLNVRNLVKMTKAFVNPGGGNPVTDVLPVPSNLYGSNFSQGNANAEIGQPLAVRVYFSNPTTSVLTGGNLTDQLPNGVVAVGGLVTGTCGNRPVAPIAANAASVVISGFTVPAANASTGTLGSCYLEFFVKGTAVQVNNTNTLNPNDVSFTGIPSMPESTSASLNVGAQAGGGAGGGGVTVEKVFYKSTGNTSQTGASNPPLLVNKDEEFWMRIAVRNLKYDNQYTNGSITDTLPLGLRVATPTAIRLLQNPPGGPNPNASYPLGCDGGAATVTNVAGQDVVTYSGWTLKNGAGSNNTTALNQGCFYSIKLVSSEDKLYTNTIGANTVTTAQGVSNIAGVGARVAVLSDVDTSKSFSPNAIGGAGGAKTRLTIKFDNKNVGVPITGLTVTDPLPSSAAFGTLKVASPAGVTSTCGGTVTAAPGASSVTLTGGTVPGNSSCQIQVDVVHSGGTATTSSITNTIAAGAVTNDQGQTNRWDVTAPLSKSNVGGVTVNKSFAFSSANGGRAVRLTVLFSATNASTVAQDLISVTDTMPAGMQVAPAPNVVTTCVKNDGTTAPDIVATPGSGSFSVAGFRFTNYTNGAAPHNSCELQLDVVVTTTGNKTNTIPAGAISTHIGTTNANPTAASLTVLPSTTVQKQFSPKRIEVGQQSTLTLTVFNVNTSPLTNFHLTDMLPGSPPMTVAGPATTTCAPGVVTAPEGGSSVKLTGATVKANDSCTVVVPVTVTAVGSYRNDRSNFTDVTPAVDVSDARDTLEAYGSSLRGTVFIDPDLDGATAGFVPATDVGLGGVTMELLRDDKVVGTAVTAATDLAAGEVFINVVNGVDVSCPVPAGGLAKGQYLFCNLPSGNDYAVRETQPVGYTTTGNKAGDGGGVPGAPGATELITPITVGAEQNLSGYDFGEYTDGVTTVSGRVYVEAGGNLTDDGDAIDPGLVTLVSITCKGPGAAPDYTNAMTSAADGTYSFTGMLPGAECTITQSQPVDYSNAYTQTGMTGEPGIQGPLSESDKGTSTDSVIATIVVPAAGSPGNNFAEVQLADMRSVTMCDPKTGAPGTAVTCTVTCTNAGPNTATNAFCSVQNAAELPGSPTPVCTGSPATTLGVGSALTCTVSFELPAMRGDIPVLAGTGASNDVDGGEVPADGNNPSQDTVSPNIPMMQIPTLGELGLLLLGVMLSALGLVHQRRRRA